MSSISVLENKFRRLALACFAAASGLNLLTLLAWWAGLPPVGGLSVAGSSVVLLLGLSTAAWLEHRPTNSAVTKGLGFVIGLAALAATGLIYGKRIHFGPAWPVENWLLLAATGDVSSLHMSKVATVGCLLAGLAWFFQARPWFRQALLRQVAAVLALALLIFGGTILLCFLLQANFFAMMAVATAVEFFLLGLGLLLATGPNTWPLRLFFLAREEVPSARRFAWGLWSLALLLGVTVVATSWYYFESQKLFATRATQEDLANLADLKAAQIADWRRERLTDARYIVNNPFAVRRALELLSQPDAPGSEIQLRDWVKPLIFNKVYDHVFVLDESLNLRLAQPKRNIGGPSEPERRAASQALKSQEIIVADLYRAAPGEAVYLSYALPLNARFLATGGRVVSTDTNAPAMRMARCVMVLRIDARTALIPLVRTWTTTSATTELELVRQEDDEVVVLNELRHRTNTALALRLPVKKHSVEGKAVLGRGKKNGGMQGQDHRDVMVLAVWRKIPDSPWTLVVKVDQDEVYAPLHRQAWTIAGFVGLLVAVAILGISLLGRQRYLNSIQRELLLERQRREGEAKFQSLFESSRDAILLLDRNTYIDCNQAALELFGLATKEQFLTKSLGELSPPRQPNGTDSRVSARDHIEAAYAHGGQFLEWQFQRQNGTLFSAEVQLSRVQVGGKDVIQLTARDITERRQAEETLRESETRLRQAASAGNVGLWSWDLRTNQVYYSPEWKRQIGYEDHEISADFSEWQSRVHPADLAPTLQQIRALIDHPHPNYAIEFRFRHKDGGYRWILTQASVRADAQGKPQRVLGSHIDITERKQAEEQLRRQAALLDAASDAIYVRNLNHAVTYWNAGAERLYGWPRTKALGRKITELGEFDHAAFEAAHTVLLKEGSWSGELTKVNQAGKKLVVFCRWTLLRDAHDRPREVLAINTDITAQKHFETEFLRSQRLEGVGRLASGVAHDLNNILAPMLMSVPTLRSITQNPTAATIFDIIEANAKRGRDIVKQLLIFGRGVEGERGPVLLRQLAEDMAAVIRETFPKDIQFQQEAPPDLWFVTANATQLHQVLLNLCINARDAMPQGGLITLKLENCTLDETFIRLTPGARTGRYVCLTVIDTGTGIAPEALDKIFDPFFSTKELGQGTGLGLSTVLGIVQSHGGFVQVHSEVGRGTQFQIFLPANGEAETTAADLPALPPPAQGGGALVLVVDDEPGVRQLMRHMLERNGYRMLEAGNGSAGMAEYVKHRSDVRLVATDLAMPGADGAHMIRGLRMLSPQLPILLMTGLEPNLTLPANAGVSSENHLAKPFSEEAFLQIVERLLRTERAPVS